jgi:hypothetical protein
MQNVACANMGESCKESGPLREGKARGSDVKSKVAFCEGPKQKENNENDMFK